MTIEELKEKYPIIEDIIFDTEDDDFWGSMIVTLKNGTVIQGYSIPEIEKKIIQKTNKNAK